MKKMSLNALKWIVVAGLGVTYASMHINFVVAYKGNEFRDTDYQLSLTEGAHPEKADAQSRILFPHLLKAVFTVVPKASWALFLSEALCSVLSFGAFFLLAELLLCDTRHALLACLGLAVFAPVGLQISYRYGEMMIVGFNSALIFLALTGREAGFVGVLALAACQRPDVAISGLCVKAVHDALAKRYPRLALDAALFAIPVGIGVLIKTHYNIASGTYLDTFFSEGWTRLGLNLAGLRQATMLYSPALIPAAMLWRDFDPAIKRIFYSMAPYFVLVTFFGSYTELRLLLPFVSILIIGVIQALRDTRILQPSK